ncbi:hypothetical protein E3N88_00583 [Mikania micrantha]|uniref:DUF1985 domain-containing protein n=1 Tax=Mikania micrantha TaxID=192012 RepID=A0A5N6PZX6_9ASTR|nr:hypothetical protein E3N88_00583 [Mikania micrantha]
MDEQYSSQPVEKPSKWILSKWRRPNFQNETSPDKCNEMQGEGSRSNEMKQPQQIKNVNGLFQMTNWSLIMIDLNSLDLVMYNNKCISGDRYRERVHPSLKKIAVYFTALLVNIRYWKVKRRQENNITYGANDDYIRPENEIYDNEALYNMKSHTRPAMDHEARIRPQVSFHIANEDNLVQEGHSLHVDRRYLPNLRFRQQHLLAKTYQMPNGLKSFLQENENKFDDDDIVRLSLLLLLYSLFKEVETDKRVEKEHLMLVDDFKAWNEFNWGSYLWGRTYLSLLDALTKKKTDREKKLKYSMTGFIWAFKIWIYESFPYMKKVCTYSEAIPRAIG